jgi:hypothetical protein
VRSSNFIDRATALLCGTFADNTPPCFYPMRPTSHKLQRNLAVPADWKNGQTPG